MLKLYENYEDRHDLIKNSKKKLPSGDMTLLWNEASGYDYIEDTQRYFK